MKCLFCSIFGILLSLSCVVLGQTRETPLSQPMKAVMQLNSPNLDTLVWGLKRAIEISEEAGDQKILLDLRIVISGPAVEQFKKGSGSELERSFRELSKFKDIQSFVSVRALNKLHKDLKDLLPGLKPVPTGMFEVLLLQRQGYFYIKP